LHAASAAHLSFPIGALPINQDDFVRTLPEDKRKRGIELRRIFEAFEGGPNGKADGLLDLAELGELMKSLGSQLTRAELEQLIEELDVNGDGQVGWRPLERPGGKGEGGRSCWRDGRIILSLSGEAPDGVARS
jgi:hypothetical protein